MADIDKRLLGESIASTDSNYIFVPARLYELVAF